MVLLTSCWFIIEAIIIPDGLFLKWFYLSFYINPVFLVVFQFFLWLKLLLSWLLLVLAYPFKIICFVSLGVFNFLVHYGTRSFSSSKITNIEIMSEDTDDLELVQSYSLSHINISNSSLIGSTLYSAKFVLVEDVNDEFDEDEEYFSDQEDDHVLINDEENMEDQNFSVPIGLSLEESMLTVIKSSNVSTENEESNHMFDSSISSPISSAGDSSTYECSTPVCSSNSNHLDVVREVTRGRDEDLFYKKYCDRMQWFDTLNNDRTCGINSILNKDFGTPTSFGSTSPMDFQMSYMPWNKISKKRLLKSIESDFELVYVAQSCLSWEALNHQYTKVSSLQNGVFINDNTAKEFQKFQVLLERFLEDERCDDNKRVSCYVRGKFSFKSLLQVPEVLVESTGEEMEGERGNAQKVLKAIERCIEAFHSFVQTDNKKIWWKFRCSLWTSPPVEDPRDLELLADLTRRLQKKELWLKDLQGKKRCWFNKVINVNTLEASQKRDILCTEIDMKLVSRVLQMSVVSSSQLKWCREKLDNIEFKENKVLRVASGPLFPP